jgi:hypothetical protein
LISFEWLPFRFPPPPPFPDRARELQPMSDQSE